MDPRITTPAIPTTTADGFYNPGHLYISNLENARQEKVESPKNTQDWLHLQHELEIQIQSISIRTLEFGMHFNKTEKILSDLNQKVADYGQELMQQLKTILEDPQELAKINCKKTIEEYIREDYDRDVRISALDLEVENLFSSID
jgi:hypothetical protein